MATGVNSFWIETFANVNQYLVRLCSAHLRRCEKLRKIATFSKTVSILHIQYYGKKHIHITWLLNIIRGQKIFHRPRSITILHFMEKLTRAPLWPDVWSMITSSPAFESSHQLPSNHRICAILFLAKYAGIERWKFCSSFKMIANGWKSWKSPSWFS